MAVLSSWGQWNIWNGDTVHSVWSGINGTQGNETVTLAARPMGGWAVLDAREGFDVVELTFLGVTGNQDSASSLFYAGDTATDWTLHAVNVERFIAAENVITDTNSWSHVDLYLTAGDNSFSTDGSMRSIYGTGGTQNISWDSGVENNLYATNYNWGRYTSFAATQDLVMADNNNATAQANNDVQRGGQRDFEENFIIVDLGSGEDSVVLNGHSLTVDYRYWHNTFLWWGYYSYDQYVVPEWSMYYADWNGASYLHAYNNFKDYTIQFRNVESISVEYATTLGPGGGGLYVPVDPRSVYHPNGVDPTDAGFGNPIYNPMGGSTPPSGPYAPNSTDPTSNPSDPTGSGGFGDPWSTDPIQRNGSGQTLNPDGSVTTPSNGILGDPNIDLPKSVSVAVGPLSSGYVLSISAPTVNTKTQYFLREINNNPSSGGVDMVYTGVGDSVDQDRVILVGDNNTSVNESGEVAVQLSGNGNKAINLVAQNGITYAQVQYQVFTDAGLSDEIIVLGTNGSETINSVASSDLVGIYGFNGNDSVIGSVSDEIILGGAGTDSLMGNAGDDYIDGEADNDYINGGSGVNTLLGGAGNDEIHAETAGSNGDVINGGAGTDTIYGGDGDIVDGGTGNDFLVAHATGGVVSFSDNSGTNTIRTNGSDDAVYFGARSIYTLPAGSELTPITRDAYTNNVNMAGGDPVENVKILIEYGATTRSIALGGSNPSDQTASTAFYYIPDASYNSINASAYTTAGTGAKDVVNFYGGDLFDTGYWDSTTTFIWTFFRGRNFYNIWGQQDDGSMYTTDTSRPFNETLNTPSKVFDWASNGESYYGRPNGAFAPWDSDWGNWTAANTTAISSIQVGTSAYQGYFTFYNLYTNDTAIYYVHSGSDSYVTAGEMQYLGAIKGRAGSVVSYSSLSDGSFGQQNSTAPVDIPVQPVILQLNAEDDLGDSSSDGLTSQTSGLTLTGVVDSDIAGGVLYQWNDNGNGVVNSGELSTLLSWNDTDSDGVFDSGELSGNSAVIAANSGNTALSVNGDFTSISVDLQTFSTSNTYKFFFSQKVGSSFSPVDDANSATVIQIDTVRPDLTLTVSNTGNSVTGTVNENASLSLVTFDGVDAGSDADLVETAQITVSEQADYTFGLQQQAAVTTVWLEASDSAGNKVDSNPNTSVYTATGGEKIIVLGTSGNDTASASITAPTLIYGFEGHDSLTGSSGSDAIYGDSVIAAQAETFHMNLRAGAADSSSLTFDADTFDGEVVTITTPHLVDTVGAAIATAFSASTHWDVTYDAANDRVNFVQKVGAEAPIPDVGTFNFTDPAGVVDTTVTTQQGISAVVGGYNDTIVASAGVDSVEGGTGSDTYKMTVSVFGNLNLNTTTAQSQGGSNTVKLTSIEAIDASDTTTGLNLTGLTNASSTIIGGSGMDIITGGAFNDSITGGTGNDQLLGGAGDDTFYFVGSDGTDAIDGGAGTADALWINANTDFSQSTISGIEYIVIAQNTATFTGAQLDNQTYAIQPTASSGSSTLQINLSGDGDFSGLTFGDTPLTNAFFWDPVGYNDRVIINGASTASQIVGTMVSDSITGGAGRDSITGGIGADLMDLGSLDGVIDTVYYSENDQTKQGVFDDATSTSDMDVIVNAELTDVINVGASTFSADPTVNTNYLTTVAANQVAIVQGTLDGSGSFTAGAGDDYIIQWTDGTVINSVILRDFGLTAPSLFPDPLTGDIVIDSPAVSATLSQTTIATFNAGTGQVAIYMDELNTELQLSRHKAFPFTDQNTFLNGAGSIAGGIQTVNIASNAVDKMAYIITTVDPSMNNGSFVDEYIDLYYFDAGVSGNYSGIIVTTDGTDTYVWADIHLGRSNETAYGTNTYLLETIAGNVTGTLTSSDFVIYTGAITSGINDFITGSESNDTIDGSYPNRTVANAETIYGGLGNDNITGGAGADTLVGGLGSDVFVYSTTADSDTTNDPLQMDVLEDFEIGTDTIDLAALGAVTLGAPIQGNWNGSAFTTGTSSSDDDWIISWTTTGPTTNYVLLKDTDDSTNLYVSNSSGVLSFSATPPALPASLSGALASYGPFGAWGDHPGYLDGAAYSNTWYDYPWFTNASMSVERWDFDPSALLTATNMDHVGDFRWSVNGNYADMFQQTSATSASLVWTDESALSSLRGTTITVDIYQRSPLVGVNTTDIDTSIHYQFSVYWG